MHFWRSSVRRGRMVLVLSLVCFLSALGWAQQQPPPQQPTTKSFPDYSKPRSHLFNLIAPYIGRAVPAPDFGNSPRVDQMIKDGKLYLSMADAITLALENNLDLAIARYNLPIADTDILRTKAGSSVRGVNTGVVQGTPGGGVGGFGSGASGAGAGGTTTGAGGAGAGASGLVTSTLGAGPAVDSFDPNLSSTLTIEHLTQPLSNTVTTGVASLKQNVGTANFNYSQAWATGTALTVGFNNNRSTSNSVFTSLVPQLSSSFQARFRQHLLAGWGLATNNRFIRIAKNNREISDVAFRQQVITTVTQIQNIYWDLVNAYEDVRVKERSLGLAEKTLADNKKQVEIGTLAPIEVVRAQSQVATSRQDLIVSQTNLQLQQLLVKNAVARDLNDQALAGADVVPTDTMSLPKQEPVRPTEELITDALAHRPELAQSRIDLTNREINKKAARNGLLPTVDLVGWYGASALAGEQNPASPLPPGTIRTTGYGHAFTTLFGNDFPDYAVGFQLNIPIRNRAAQADQVRSELEYRQAQVRSQQLQNQIRIEVRNAQFAVQQNRARVDAAQAAVQLASETLDAEQKKYALGASTNILVLQAQRDVAQAETNLVAAKASYEKSRVELDRATGLTLTRLGIEIADAERGQVSKEPVVPGVEPRKEKEMPPQSQPQGGPQASSRSGGQ
jgi:outer membrane protein